MNKIFPVTIAMMLMAASMNAQPQGARPAPPKMKEPAEMAKEQADKMQSELALDKKQYKKVYKLLKSDFEYRQKAVEEKFQGGMPPQGAPGMGGPGGGMNGGMMGGPGGGMGGGMMGGPGMGGGMMGGPGGGGMPQGEMPQGGMQPGQHPGGPGPDDAVTEEYLEKQDKKLQKILTAEQYEKWRAKHPAEHLELPPMELK